MIITAKYKSLTTVETLRSIRTFGFFLLGCWTLTSLIVTQAHGQFLEEALRRIPYDELAVRARTEGDATRGAIAFHLPALACARCHALDESGPSIGPRLIQSKRENGSDITDRDLVESILEPSKSIAPAYQAVRIRTQDDDLVAGIVAHRSDAEFHVVESTGATRVIAADAISEMETSTLSLMPAGLAQSMGSEQTFLDLVRYLMEIRDGGPSRARSLQPSESMLASVVPEYEQHIDHRGMISDWSAESLERGEAIYRRVCANCHGTREQVGSLPTALRFAEGKFKNGSDPYAIYRTLTHGFGFMPAQSWMVPQQKYDVIHYLLENYIQHNRHVPTIALNEAYLASLPRGDSRGPAPSTIEVWSAMDYGNFLTHCYEVPGSRLNIATKGIAIRIDPGSGGIARGNQWMLFDSDTLRWAAGWTNKKEPTGARFIDWRDIQFNGEHGIHPRIVGGLVFGNADGPGWANPSTGSFEDDQRTIGRDQRRYGPLPKAWGKYQGVYSHGGATAVAYAIGGVSIMESPTLWTRSAEQEPIFVRELSVGARSHPLELRIADLTDAEIEVVHMNGIGPSTESVSDAGTPHVLVVSLPTRTFAVCSDGDAPQVYEQDGQLRVRLPARAGSETLAICHLAHDASAPESVPGDIKEIRWELTALLKSHPIDFDRFLRGGAARWAQELETSIQRQGAPGSKRLSEFDVDVLTWPESNPWLAQLRLTGLDFFSDGSLAICTWDGDVWRVREDVAAGTLRWKRIASGLFQPLGIVVRADKVYLTCRDQLALLHDVNGDEEADWVECFNHDHQVTEHFHEFAMGLQIDDAGNFYYAKSGRHALEAVVPQHGTLLQVSPDGASTKILATGFRAANGVCLNPDGSFIVTDQEGFWNPKNRINWVTLRNDGKPNFYGNMFGYHDVTDTSDNAMVPPLCWITNAFDRSPAELMWIRDAAWKEMDGGLLNFSYGYGKVFWVLHEKVEGLHQGGMIELPIPSFPTGVMRGRIHPTNHWLYTCGMFSWAGNATAPGGLYRIRRTSNPLTLPVALRARKSGLELTFATPLDPSSANADRLHVRAWDLKRSARYGSDHFNEREWRVTNTKLSADRKTLQVGVEGLQPTWGMEIRYTLFSESGHPIEGVIHNTIHALGD